MTRRWLSHRGRDCLAAIALFIFIVVLLSVVAPSFGQEQTYWVCNDGFCIMREDTLQALVNVVRECL